VAEKFDSQEWKIEGGCRGGKIKSEERSDRRGLRTKTKRRHPKRQSDSLKRKTGNVQKKKPCRKLTKSVIFSRTKGAGSVHSTNTRKKKNK